MYNAHIRYEIRVNFGEKALDEKDIKKIPFSELSKEEQEKELREIRELYDEFGDIEK